MPTDYEVQLVAKEEAGLVEMERDLTPLDPHEVAGPTVATLVSRGTEMACFQEQHSYYGPPTYPYGSGYAAVFCVEAVGEAVTAVRPGDFAFAQMCHRSYLRNTEDRILRVPDGLAPQRATIARMMGISMTTLTTTQAAPPDRVLVTGLGIVGNCAAQVFQRCGYRVTAVDPSEPRRELARGCGIEDVREAVPLDDDAIADRVALALECSGHETAAIDCCRVIRKRGEVVLCGVPWVAKTDRLAHELLFDVFYRYVTLRGGWEPEIPLTEKEFRRGSRMANFAAALDWLAEGRIKTKGLYEVLPATSAPAGFRDLLHNRTAGLTVLFDWTDLATAPDGTA
jgi:threonine dehydrogenase-like Zn-dependent dehydrogenase